MKLMQFKYVVDSANNRKPENTHLIIETSAGLLYMVDSADNTKVYGSNDKGATWTQIDIDPSNSSGDNKSRDEDIQALWHDRSNSKIYGVDCNNDGVSTTFYVWYLDYSAGFGSESITEIGSEDISGNAWNDDACYANDIFVIDGTPFVSTKEYEVIGYNSYAIYDVSSAPFTEKDRETEGT